MYKGLPEFLWTLKLFKNINVHSQILITRDNYLVSVA